MTTRVPDHLRSLDETCNRIERVTKSGKRLFYELRVIQQPQRARACGSGAKSSADRRPVDPPPVVELRIYEGESWEKNEDVTFAYTANFFLFATLEVSRPMANPRGHVQAPPPPQIPVLTGMPVSGMAYLDRPTEAGYFIFPDLSVRHEGMYKLTFNLYEQVKEEDQETDSERSQQQPSNGSANMDTPDSSFDWRFEVKSKQFQVYSAKKFPGLTESTGLSRQIAEQGCRVRIRRDIRMRRREPKCMDDPYPEPELQLQDYARPGRAPEQEPYDASSPRSRSSSSEGELRSPNRGSSDNGEFPTPGQYPPAPGQNLAWMDGGHSGPPPFQAPAPPQYQPQPPGPQQYQSGPHNYPPGPPTYRPTQPHYDYNREYPQSAHPSNPPREREPEPEWRRASFPQPPPPHSRPNHYPSVDSSFPRPPPHMQRPHSPAFPPVSLAPLKMPSEHRFDAAKPSPLPSVNRTIPSLPSVYDRPQGRSGSYSHYPAQAPAQPELRAGKRAYDTVFAGAAAANNAPLHNGHRPRSGHSNPPFDDDDDNEDAEMAAMTYKRADGNVQARRPPHTA